MLHIIIDVFEIVYRVPLASESENMIGTVLGVSRTLGAVLVCNAFVIHPPFSRSEGPTSYLPISKPLVEIYMFR